MGNKTKVIEATESTAIAVYQEPQFNDLNKAIEALGNNSKELSKEEKEIGYKLLDEWERNVISRISDKAKQLESILAFFGLKDSWYHMESNEYEYMKGKLAEVSETQDLFLKYKECKEERQQHKLTNPVRPVVNPNISIIENDKAYVDYEKEQIEWNIKDKQLKYIETKAKMKWINTMKKKESIKEMMSGITEYLRKVKLFKQSCKDKAQLAKINLAISNEKVRESIKDIIEFTNTLK